ncbi:hypothetical protein GJ496_011039 [Pomphorhynchus laevis]|nr:hypothetical protein GJ496_011039 [Pomphorhynchus laevis]
MVVGGEQTKIAFEERPCLSKLMSMSAKAIFYQMEPLEKLTLVSKQDCLSKSNNRSKLIMHVRYEPNHDYFSLGPTLERRHCGSFLDVEIMYHVFRLMQSNPQPSLEQCSRELGISRRMLRRLLDDPIDRVIFSLFAMMLSIVCYQGDNEERFQQANVHRESKFKRQVLKPVRNMLVSQLLCRLVSVLLGAVLPGYTCYRALSNHDRDAYEYLLVHWFVYSTFVIFDEVLGIFLCWIPFYYEIKLVFLLWLLYPKSSAVKTVYDNFFVPFYQKNEQDIKTISDSIENEGLPKLLSLIPRLVHMFIEKVRMVTDEVSQVRQRRNRQPQTYSTDSTIF